MVTEVAVGSRVAESTVANAARGDTDAFALIVGAYHDDMARIAFIILGDQDRAQDAVQSAWPIAWRKLGALRDAGKLRPWLMAIAANEARGLIRRERRHIVTEISVADVEAVGSDPAGRSAQLDLAAALRELPPLDRTILALRHVADFDATEIGRVVGMSPSGVRTRLARLLARLRSELEHD